MLQKQNWLLVKLDEPVINIENHNIAWDNKPHSLIANTQFNYIDC